VAAERYVMSKKIKYVIIGILPFIIACAGATGNIGADHPIERGLSYVAAAIVTHGILMLFAS